MISSISETESAEPSRPLFTVGPEEVEWSVVGKSNTIGARRPLVVAYIISESNIELAKLTYLEANCTAVRNRKPTCLSHTFLVSQSPKSFTSVLAVFRYVVHMRIAYCTVNGAVTTYVAPGETFSTTMFFFIIITHESAYDTPISSWTSQGKAVVASSEMIRHTSPSPYDPCKGSCHRAHSCATLPFVPNCHFPYLSTECFSCRKQNQLARTQNLRCTASLPFVVV